MAKKQRPQAIQDRAQRTAAAMASGGAVAQAERRGSAADFVRNLPKFSNEVRAETRKITWPSRRETWITSVMVALMVAMTALFFWVVNSGISLAITQILKLASAG